MYTAESNADTVKVCCNLHLVYVFIQERIGPEKKHPFI